ncbi:MAG: CrcB family protein [Flavobacteriales bacterium]
MNIIIAIFIGGGLGSLARFGVSQITPSGFAYGTLVSNVLACVVMSLALYVFSSKIETSSFLKYLIVIGFCGGFSTFSTFSFETFEFIRSGNFMLATINILVNVAFCLFVFYIFRNSFYTA